MSAFITQYIFFMRTHSVMLIVLIDDVYACSIKHSKLNLVDLAGSERQRGTGAEGIQLK